MLSFIQSDIRRGIGAVVLSLLMLLPAAATQAKALQQATFAGGCFWCMEPAFAKLAGVEKVTVGYTGGHVVNPTYEQVSAGATGHVEAIQVTYTPEKVPYQALLDIFWKNVDPTDAQGQFCDKGEQYRAGIFTHTPLLKPKIASCVSCRNVYAKAIRLRISFRALRSCVSGVCVNGLPLLNAST